jgi:hypothetical protein
MDVLSVMSFAHMVRMCTPSGPLLYAIVYGQSGGKDVMIMLGILVKYSGGGGVYFGDSTRRMCMIASDVGSPIVD